MICPDCGYDNIEGVDWCEQCGQPLVEFDPATCELEESISRHSIRVLSPKPAISVPPSCTVREAVRMMAQRNIGCLLVQDSSGVAGVFTERDVLNRISPDMTAMDRPVSDYMTLLPRDHSPAGFHRLRAARDGHRRLPPHGRGRFRGITDWHSFGP